jgi:hypothetical protein
MIRAGGPIAASFSTSAAPTGTPTAVLVRTGVETGVAVTVTGSGTVWYLSATVPNDATSTDWFCFKVTTTVSGVTDSKPTAQQYVEGSHVLTSAYDAAKTAAAPGAAMTLTPTERTTLAGSIEAGFLDDLTGGAFLAGIQSQIQALFDQGADVPVATIVATIVAAVRADLTVELGRIDATISSRATPVAVPTAAENATAAAASILVTPAQKIVTNASGFVTSTNGGSGSGDNYVFPIVSTTAARVTGNRVELFTREQIPTTIDIVDAAGTPVNCTGKTALLTLGNGVTLSDLSPAVLGNSVPYRYTFTVPTGSVAADQVIPFSLRVAGATNEVLAFGTIRITAVP